MATALLVLDMLNDFTTGSWPIPPLSGSSSRSPP